MVTFSTVAGSAIRDDLKRRSAGSGQWMLTVQDGKDLRVRFLQEPENWVRFREHYSEATKYFPCTGDDSTCPGCTSDSDALRRASTRYAANVIDKARGDVRVLKMPLDLANRVTAKCDRNGGTLLNRDITLIRSGKSTDTTYDVEIEDKVAMNLDMYELQDAEAFLQQTFQDAIGSAPIASAKPVKALHAVADEAQAQTDDEPPWAIKKEEPKAEAPADDNEITVEELNAMSETQLKALLSAEGLVAEFEESGKEASAEGIRGWIIEKFSA